jgi:hypothetical protein
VEENVHDIVCGIIAFQRTFDVVEINHNLILPNAILTSNIQSSPLRFLAMSFHFGITLVRKQILAIKRKSCHKFIAK